MLGVGGPVRLDDTPVGMLSDGGNIIKTRMVRIKRDAPLICQLAPHRGQVRADLVCGCADLGGVGVKPLMPLGVALNEIGLDLIEHFGNEIGTVRFRHDLTRESMKIKMYAEKVVVSFHGSDPF